jgi:hypothetical protein
MQIKVTPSDVRLGFLLTTDKFEGDDRWFEHLTFVTRAPPSRLGVICCATPEQWLSWLA